MTVTHGSAIRNSNCDNTVDSIDAGGRGNLIFQTAGSAEVATNQFAVTAFGGAVAGVATAGTVDDDTSATGGTVTKFVWQSGGAADVVLGSVTATAGGGDIEMTNPVVAPGSTVQVVFLTYESAP